jgi:5-methylcytosine-specific restriction enzyme A
MPALMRVCTEHGCPVLVRRGRCIEHQRQRRHTYNTTHLHALYRTPRWRRLREQKMRENPWCVDCFAEGIKNPWDDLDHDPPHGGDIEAFWDESRLFGRCKAHHMAKTRRGE